MKFASALIVLLLIGFCGSTSVSADAAMDGWRSAAVKTFVQNQTYPRSALASETEGRAMVMVRVSKDGSILDHNLMQSTGSAVLDREVSKVIERVGQLSPVPGGDEVVTLVVPLVWSLG